MEDNSPNFDNEKLSENNEQKSTNSKTEDKNKFKKKDLNDPNPFSNIFDKERKDKIIKILEKYAPYFAKIIKEKKNTFNIEKVYQKFEVGRKKKEIIQIDFIIKIVLIIQKKKLKEKL